MVATKFIAHTFTKSILQCFCQSCQVPNVEKKVISPPPRTMSASVVRKPPKKVAFLATEVRCSEQSKGGIKYELVLSAPAADSPKHVARSPPKSSLSIEEIEKKLKKAEERRQSVELQKLSFVTEKLNNLETVNKKKEEFNNNFMQTAKESLEQKLESMKENRDTHIKNIQEKARDAVTKVEEKRKGGDSPDKEEKLEAIRKKLNAAGEQREAHLNSLLEKLREHDKHISDVQKQIKDQSEAENLRQKSIQKLEQAETKRNTMLKEIQEKMKEHNSNILKVRHFNEVNQVDEKLSQIQQKLNSAERKRTIQFQAMLEKLQEHERHSEVVRQKALSFNNEENAKENLSG